MEQPGHRLCIAGGLVLLVVFYFVELRTASPLMQVRIFRIRAFSVENLVLGISMLAFIPVFFFASEYAQISLAKSASEAGLFLLYFFIGFVIAAQIGGRMLDRGGAKRPVVLGCALAAVGFALWAGKVTQLSFGDPAVVHHPGRRRDGPDAGAGQHRRRQPGVPPLLRGGDRHHPDGPELRGQPGPGHPGHRPGLPDAVPRHLLPGVPGGARRHRRPPGGRGQPQAQGGNGSAQSIPHFIRLDFAYATRSVLIGMAVAMAAAAVVGLIGLRRGLQQDPEAMAADAALEGQSDAA